MGDGFVIVGKDGTQGLQSLLRCLAVFHGRGSVDALANLFYLVFQAVGLFVSEVDGQRLDVLDGIYHLLCQFDSSLATLEEGLVHGKADTQILAVFPDDIDFLFVVRVMAVERHDDGLSEALHIINVAVQVLQTFLQSLHIGLLDSVQGHSAMHLQTLCRGDDNHQTRLESGLTAFDVEELLCTEVGTETCLCHHIVTKGHGHLCGYHT